MVQVWEGRQNGTVPRTAKMSIWRRRSRTPKEYLEIIQIGAIYLKDCNCKSKLKKKRYIFLIFSLLMLFFSQESYCKIITLPKSPGQFTIYCVNLSFFWVYKLLSVLEFIVSCPWKYIMGEGVYLIFHCTVKCCIQLWGPHYKTDMGL